MFSKISEKHKAKALKGYRYTMHYTYLHQMIASAFEYTGLPDSVPPEMLEAYLLSNGTVGIGYIGDTLYCGAGSYVGDYNGYIPDNYIFAVPAKGNVQGKAVSPCCREGGNVVVGWNDLNAMPCMDIVDTAQALTESRTSEDLNVIFSRFLRIPVAEDSKQREAIESAINALIDGKINAVTSPYTRDVLGEIVHDMQFLDLVDVKETDKLQYLTQFYDNILKRFMRRHGMPFTSSQKVAQQSTDEVHGADNFSMIYPMIQLKYRKRMIEDINKTFGLSATVDFSEMYENSLEKIESYENIEGEGSENEEEDREDSTGATE